MAIDHPPTERSPLLHPQQGNRGAKHVEDEINEIGADLERHDSTDAERAAQFAGNPEVQKQLKWIVPAVAVGVYMAAADQTIIVSSYGKIGSDFHALQLTSWIATSYMVSLASFQPLYGKLSDIFGRKNCLLFAYIIFGLGGLFCGLAQTIEQLIVARLFQGIGGGGMTVVVSVALSDVVPLKDRGIWQGLINVIYAAGAASGAPLGGWCSDVIGWRWTFLIQAPLSLVALIAVALVMKLPPIPKQDLGVKFKRIDFLGAFVLVLAVFGFLFGMDRGSNVSWTVPASYGSLVASVVLFLLFFYIEERVASEPFAPSRIIFTRNMFATYTCYFFSFAGWLSMLFYLPLYFQAIDGVSATTAGLRLLPAIATIVTGSLTAGFIIRATGKYYWLTVTAYFLLTIGIIPIILFSGVISENLPAVLVGSVIAGMGNGIGVTSALIALIADASPADQAIATACSYLFRGLGSTVGVSLSATVVQSVLRSTLRRDLGGGSEAEEIERNVRESLDYLKELDPAVQAIVRNAYAVAVRHCYVLILGLCSVSFVSAFFIREKRLSR